MNEKPTPDFRVIAEAAASMMEALKASQEWVNRATRILATSRVLASFREIREAEQEAQQRAWYRGILEANRVVALQDAEAQWDVAWGELGLERTVRWNR